MSNLGIKEREYLIDMPIDETYKIVCAKKKDATHREVIYMAGISEKKNSLLRNNKEIVLTFGKDEFKINPDDVYCHGKIDFNPGSLDCIEIDSFNWLDGLEMQGICVPSKYNYEKHQCSSPINKYLYTETFRPSVICRYLHGCLGKPEHTVIFRRIV